MKKRIQSHPRALAAFCVVIAALAGSMSASANSPPATPSPVRAGLNPAPVPHSFLFNPFLAQSTVLPPSTSPDLKRVEHKDDKTPAHVPDGGTTVLLLGGAFVGLALLVKKLKA